MRLRRETGDFQIKVTDNDGITVNTIRTGLGAEDLIGEVVSVNNTLSVINTATERDDGTVVFVAMDVHMEALALVYHKATGEITGYRSGGEEGNA